MNILSLFDGMSCGQIALDEMNIVYENYFAYEIKPHAIKVTQHNYPNTIQKGSVICANFKDLPKIDLLYGGSPCQSFSRSGDGSGFDGKSKLFWEFVRALEETKPKYFLLENVVMKKEWENIISDALGVKPIKINSKDFVAQNRPRLYWTNIQLDDINKNNTYLKDVLGLDTIYPLKDGIDRIIVVEKVNVRKYDVDVEGLKHLLKSNKNKTINQISTELGIKKTTVEHWFRNDKCFSIPEPNIWYDLKKCINITSDIFDKSICTFIEKDNVFDMGNRIYKINGKSPTLTATNKKIKTIDDNGKIIILNSNHFETLQGVPVGYTDILSQNQAMNLIGDGWTIPVIKYIFKNIK